MKPKIAIVRGKFLNKYEMQFFEPLVSEYDITAFGSLTCYHDKFAFPVVKLPSPVDLPEFPYKTSILNRLFVDAHYLWGLEERLKGFDLVHSAETYFHYTQQCFAAKEKGYVSKVIATVLENIPFNNEGIWGRRHFKSRAREKLDHIVALTELTRNALLEEGTNPTKITIIQHYVDTKRFAPRKKTIGKDKKMLTILFTGRLEEYKGVYDVLEAAHELLADPELQSYNLTFRFIGSGSQKEAMDQKEEELGIRSHIEHRSVGYESMPKVYQAADIFVAPSKPTRTWAEQYCTVLLEAQASGLPIITTKTGGIPENIGGAGILIAPGDPLALVREIKRLVLFPQKRRALGARARKRAITTHDISIGAKKLSSLYNTLLA